jgi:predicted phosphodiesterase
MRCLNRRTFLGTSAALTTATLGSLSTPQSAAKESDAPQAAFFLVGDTHYLANRDRPAQLDATSKQVCSSLVETLNRLPGEAIPEQFGGGSVAKPQGVIHAGDVIDSGDKNGGIYAEMQRTEWSAFRDDYGLTGSDGRLKWPVYEVHGNHDSPRGDGYAIDQIKERNKQRPGLLNISDNGVHYSWDWGGVHFVNLGIVVGRASEPERSRRYAPLDSLSFLISDLKEHVADRKRPIVITHHIDVARNSGGCDAQVEAKGKEWDGCDVQAFYASLQGYQIAAILYGHTHVRNVFRWTGQPGSKSTEGIPVFNNDNSSHFHDQKQAMLYFEITDKQLMAREYSTADAWQTGAWTAVWKMPLA